MSELIKVLVADDSEIVRESTARFLRNGGYDVVAQAGSVEEVGSLGPEIIFAIAVLDGDMPRGGDGKRAADLLRKNRPTVKIVSLSVDSQTWGDVNVSKRESPDVLLEALNQLAKIIPIE